MRLGSPLLAVSAMAIAAFTYVCVDSQRRVEGKQAVIEETWEAAATVVLSRAELAHGLAEAVQASAPDLRELATSLIEARAAVEAAERRSERIAAHTRLTEAFSGVLAETGDRPELQLNPDLQRIQDELAAAENDMAAARRRYNDAVQDYNTFIQLFPNNLVAGLAGFAREDAYFRTTEQDRQAEPGVKFSRQEVESPE